MARYDRGWGRSGGTGGYDRGYQRQQPSWSAGDGELGMHGRWFSLAEEPPGRPQFADGLYGPSRYGLGPYYERLRTRRRADDELRTEVQDALFFDTWVDADAITVEVAEGVVTLRGELPSFEEVRYATDDAWDVDGVVGVRSELTVRGGPPGAGR